MRRILRPLIAGILFVFVSQCTFAETNLATIRLDEDTRTLLREATSDKWFKKDTAISTLIGGIMAAIGGFAAVWLAHRLQANHEARAEERFNVNALAAIRRELEALQRIYENGIGKALRQVADGQFLETSFAMSQNWFTVFDANAAHLGRIDAELAKQIVTSYALLKALVEEFKINNEYLKRWREIPPLAPISGGILRYPAERSQIEGRLVDEAKRLKELETELRVAVVAFFAQLDKRGIK